MTITPSAAWTASIGSKQSNHVVVLAEIWVDFGSSLLFLSAPASGITTEHGIIAGMTEITRDVDTWTSITRAGSLTLNIARDEFSESMVEDYGVKGAFVTISIGEESMAASGYLKIYSGRVEDMRPDLHQFVLTVTSANDILNRHKLIPGKWFNQHPGEMIKYMLDTTFFTRCPSDNYSSTELAYDYDLAISHFVVGTVVKGTMVYSASAEPIEAIEPVSQISALMDSVFVQDENGKLVMKRLDQSAASTFDWTENDIGGELLIESLYEDIANRISCKSKVDLAEKVSTYRVDDEDSQAAFPTVYPALGETDSVFNHDIESDWCGGIGYIAAASPAPGEEPSPLMTDASPGAGDTFRVQGGAICNFSGTRATFDPSTNAWTQAANAKLSDSRIAYLLIDDEVISCDRCTVDNAANTQAGSYDPATGVAGNLTVPLSATFRVLARGALGTTASAHGSDWKDFMYNTVHDITVQKWTADRRLARNAYGSWKIKVRTGLDKAAVQLGDIGTVTCSEKLFFAYKTRGLSAEQKWIVTSKKVAALSDNPCVEWTLQLVYTSTFPTLSPTTFVRAKPAIDLNVSAWASAASGLTLLSHAKSGLEATGISGLTCTVSAGVMSTGVSQFATNPLALTVQASKDTYLGVNMANGDIVIQAVANGAAQPDKPSGCIWVRKVVSGAAAITSSASVAETKVLDGARLVAASVDSTEIKAGAVTEAKLGAAAVTAAKLGTAAVTTTKVASDAITARQMSRETPLTGTRSFNWDLSVWDD